MGLAIGARRAIALIEWIALVSIFALGFGGASAITGGAAIVFNVVGTIFTGSAIVVVCYLAWSTRSNFKGYSRALHLLTFTQPATLLGVPLILVAARWGLRTGWASFPVMLVTAVFLLARVSVAIGSNSALASATRAFTLFQAILPRRYTNEEFGDALEKISKLETVGVPKWRLRVIAAKAIFWVLFNVAREWFPLLAALKKLFG